MEVSLYEQVVYENIYDGATLIVSMKEDGLKFDLEAKTRTAAEKFSIEPWGMEEQYDASRQAISHPKAKKSFKITSDNETMPFSKEKGFKFKNPEKASSGNLSFEISIK